MKTKVFIIAYSLTIIVACAQDICFSSDNKVELLNDDEFASLCKFMNGSTATYAVSIRTCLDMNVTKSIQNLCTDNGGGSTHGEYLAWMSWSYFTTNIRLLLPVMSNGSRFLIVHRQPNQTTSAQFNYSLTEEQVRKYNL